MRIFALNPKEKAQLYRKVVIMNPVRSLALFTLLLLFCLPLAALASQRAVLIETFTNVSCLPCASANPVTEQFVADYGYPLVMNIQYHVSWPSNEDPFYLTAPEDNFAALSYYDVTGVPNLVIGGTNQAFGGDYNLLEQASLTLLGTPTSLTMEVSAVPNGSDISVQASVTASETLGGDNLSLRIALVEPHVHYDEPPGTNGETDFHYSMRDMLPDFAGTSFSINPGQTLTFTEIGTVDPTWQDIYAVAWIQNDQTREILQASASLVSPDHVFFYSGYRTGEILPLGQTAYLPSHLYNLGNASDIYDLHIDRQIPDGWSAVVCTDGTCYPPFVDDIYFSLASGGQTEVTVDLLTAVTGGEGTVTITATSRADPTRSWSQAFKVITDGLDILVVDDDEGVPYEDYFTAALQPLPYSYAVWDQNVLGELSAENMAFFEALVWGTGLGYPTLSTTDQTTLGEYLEGGGRLFLTGQDVGWDMCDLLQSPHASPESIAWYNTYLGAEYVLDIMFDNSIQGISGDPIGDGLNFNINGGTGADNQPYPSEIAPFGEGQACFRYTPGKIAGVHLNTGQFKTVYLAFGLEGISELADRELVMDRTMDWLINDPSGVPDGQPIQAFLASSPQAVPNPFNPETSIGFRVGGTQSALVKIEVFDLRGHRVRDLFRGLTEPGEKNFVWDGRSDNGNSVASGAYIAQVSVGKSQQSLKLTLAK